MLVVLGTSFFPHLLLHAPKTLDRRPWLVVGVRIIHPDVHFEHVAVIDRLPALDYVQMFAVRGAVVVYEGLLILPDGIDHERVALTMADRLAVPGRLWICGMGYVEIDAPHLCIARKDHRDLLTCLDPAHVAVLAADCLLHQRRDVRRCQRGAGQGTLRQRSRGR